MEFASVERHFRVGADFHAPVAGLRFLVGDIVSELLDHIRTHDHLVILPAGEIPA